jgi:hypothetical protein
MNEGSMRFPRKSHLLNFYFLQMFLASQFWSKQDMISVLDHLTFEAVQEFVKQVMIYSCNYINKSVILIVMPELVML